MIISNKEARKILGSIALDIDEKDLTFLIITLHNLAKCQLENKNVHYTSIDIG